MVEKLLLIARKTGHSGIKVSTQTCESESKVLQQVERDPHSIGITSSQAASPLISSSIIDREELMLIYNIKSDYSHDSIDLSQLFNEKIWLPELGSDTLKVFENKIKPLGLDLGDFRYGEHLSEPIMLDLIRSGAGIGIGLCNHKDHGSKHFKLVRINEFSTPYAIYAHCQIQSSAVVQALFKSIKQSSFGARRAR